MEGAEDALIKLKINLCERFSFVFFINELRDRVRLALKVFIYLFPGKPII